MTKRGIYIGSVLLVLSIAGAVGYYWYVKNAANQPAIPNNVYTDLMKSNQAFSSGEQLFKANDPKGAVREYQLALSSAQNKLEEGQIKNKIAAAMVASGDVMEAIDLSKQVAADEAYGSISRAYAVRFMGQLLFSPWLSAKKNSIKEAIFKDEPYKGFASATDDSVSYRNLFDYSASLYPLALSELMSARWYADALYALKQKSSLSAADTEKIREYLQIISQKVILADADIARVKKIENENITLPSTYLVKALVNTRIVQARETYNGMVSPESVYEEALAYAHPAQMVSGEASLQYRYALYLARRYGESRVADIKAHLNDFYNSERFASTTIMYIFKNEKANDVVTNENIRLLAGIDSGFKAFLQKKGWKF